MKGLISGVSGVVQGLLVCIKGGLASLDSMWVRTVYVPPFDGEAVEGWGTRAFVAIAPPSPCFRANSSIEVG